MGGREVAVRLPGPVWSGDPLRHAGRDAAKSTTPWLPRVAANRGTAQLLDQRHQPSRRSTRRCTDGREDGEVPSSAPYATRRLPWRPVVASALANSSSRRPSEGPPGRLPHPTPAGASRLASVVDRCSGPLRRAPVLLSGPAHPPCAGPLVLYHSGKQMV